MRCKSLWIKASDKCKCIQIENSHFKCLILFHNITVFYCVFDQINAALVRKETSFEKFFFKSFKLLWKICGI